MHSTQKTVNYPNHSKSLKKRLNNSLMNLRAILLSRGERGILNEREFIAELANPVFREKLQSVDKDKKKSLWQRIVDVFKKLLGIHSSSPYYTRMMDAIDRALNAFDIDTYLAYNHISRKDHDSFIKNKEELENSGGVRQMNCVI